MPTREVPTREAPTSEVPTDEVPTREALTVKVWGPLVRVSHWLLVLAIVLSWLSRHGWGIWHERAGYFALTVVLTRVLWGFLGPAQVRFTDFVRSPSHTLGYLGQVLRRAESRHLGHNPLGGWMIVALLLVSGLVALSGWLYTTDRFWGIEWVENLHSLLADVLVALAVVHLAGVLYGTFRHRENLVASMIHGRKRA